MHPIGTPFNIIDSVDSTNRLAMQEAVSGKATVGTAYFSLEQTAGRGQRGRVWVSDAGLNIALSVIIEPEGLDPAHPFPLSCAAALAASDLFAGYAGEETSVKWPNDIYWRDRKAGGILIENSMRGAAWRFAIVGFGININQTVFDPRLPNPVSLRQITGRMFHPMALATELCQHFKGWLDRLYADGFEPLLSTYNARCYGRGRTFRFRSGGADFEASVRGVDESGLLITEGCRTRSHRFGELEWGGPVEGSA